MTPTTSDSVRQLKDIRAEDRKVIDRHLGCDDDMVELENAVRAAREA